MPNPNCNPSKESSDSAKVRATKNRISDALFSLLAEDSIDRITIGEVCAKAKINRSTFYNHFKDIYDVRAQREDAIEAAIRKSLPLFMNAVIRGQNSVSVEIINEHLEPHFESLRILLNGGDPAFTKRIQPVALNELLDILGEEKLSMKQEYVFVSIASMQISLLSHWLQSGQSMPLPDLLELMKGILQSGPRTVLLGLNE